MKKPLIITLIIAIIASTGFYFKSTSGDEIKATPVELTQVAKNKIIQKVNATGKIQPKTKINISADVSAKIINLYVEEGEWVEKR